MSSAVEFQVCAHGRDLRLSAVAIVYPLDVLLAGVVAITSAALLNHATLTRRQAIYRPAPLEQG